VSAAVVVPFPLASRRVMIQRQANYAAELSLDAAERHIQQQLKTQADTMRRRGIGEEIIARELRAMEGAIRSMLERAVSGGAQ
jgi:hypothetical protein